VLATAFAGGLAVAVSKIASFSVDVGKLVTWVFESFVGNYTVN